MSLPDRWFRTHPDSSVFDRPRLLARSLLNVAELDDRIPFYERLLGVAGDLRMPIPDFGGLELAAVGNLLLIASDMPFTPIQRETAFSLIVPSLNNQLEKLLYAGATILEPPESILPGSRARVRYPDGSIAELVEHRPHPEERTAGLPCIASNGSNATDVRLLARRALPRVELDKHVEFYESALETKTEVRVVPRSAVSCELAIVGNLLLVASDEPDSKDATHFAFALLASSVDEVKFRLGLDETTEGELTGFNASGRTTATLPGGALAEVWYYQSTQP